MKKKEEKDDLTKEQVEVYASLWDTLAKFILAMVVAAVFIAVTVKLIIDPGWPVAATDSVISIVVIIVFKHYFPSKNAPPAPKAKQRKRKADPEPEE